MSTFEVTLGDGRTIEVDAPDGATAAKVAARYERQAAPKTPYDKARGKLATRDESRRRANLKGGGEFLGRIANAGDDLTAQVARNTGAFDELAGGLNFVTQGTENIGRRLTGRAIEIPAATAGKAAMDYEREQQARYAKEHPTGNAVATGATIATSARPAGVGMMTNPLRAGAAAAAQNAPFAVARQEGNIAERAPGAAAETALTFGMGAAMTAGSNVLRNRAAVARARPASDQRQLSRAGVDLTPGQMLGGGFQRAEDAATSIPVVGDAIRDARVRGIETFDRTAINRVLAPIGQQLPANVQVGRDGVREATTAISNAYENALQGVSVAPDQQFAQDIAAAVNNVQLPANVDQELQTVINNTLTNRFRGPIDGRLWKDIDSELAASARAADAASANQPSQRYLRDALNAVRQAHRGVLERTNPAALAAVSQADEATANLIRVREASQYAGTSARGGVFSPADLNRAVRGTDTSAGNRAFAQGDALMQDLTDPAMRVLPQQVPDSGTPFRSLMTVGGLSGGGMAVGADPTAIATGGALLMTGAGAYSRPAQALLNAVYRASTPGQAQEALSALAAAAARDPAIVPAYEAALQQLGVQLPRGGGQQSRQSGQPVSMTQ